MRLKQLEMQLAGLETFDEPSPSREQYPTPPDLAARLLYHAFMRGDIEGKSVCDLGSGTGVLAIGAALLGASPVTGVEVDPRAIRIASRNAVRRRVSVRFIEGDLDDPALPSKVGPHDTVVMNPPFGAQNPHADRIFLDKALEIAPVFYSVLNRGSRDFLTRYIQDRAHIVETVQAVLSLKRTFSFHRKDKVDIPVEIVIVRRTSF
ncbi:MAG: METTL5 family protein [Methanolinea sp.]|nr:METTL5 family protein [Methanolinea sp.]